MKPAILQLLIFFLLFHGFNACKRSKPDPKPQPDPDNKNSAADEATTPSPEEELFKCNYSDVVNQVSEAVVYNATNVTDILCEASIDMSGLPSTNVSEDDMKRMCKYLGNTFCYNCSMNSLYWVNVSNVVVSCVRDLQTTHIPTTIAILTTTDEVIISTTQTLSTSANSVADTSSENDAILGTMEIGIIGGIAGVLCLILIVLLIVLLCKRKRKDKEVSRKGSVLHFQTEDTGELYTVVNKGKGESKTKENILYGTNNEPERVGDVELYTIVDKKGNKNDYDDKETTENILYEQNNDEQPATNDLYTVVDKNK